MNKTPRLSKSGIEYLDYQWGVFSGCHNWRDGICPVQNCWAKGFANRFPRIYPNGFEPTFYLEAVDSPLHLKKPSIIGVGWAGDVIGYCNKVSERSLIMRTILLCPQHRFLFLTKNPERLPTWSPFPNNCWVGVSVTNEAMAIEAVSPLCKIDAKVKYISFEPLLGRIRWQDLSFINWLIIGAQTNPYKPPKLEWVEEIVKSADKAGIPVFLKDNLQPLYEAHYPVSVLRQEMPE